MTGMVVFEHPLWRPASATTDNTKEKRVQKKDLLTGIIQLFMKRVE